MVHVDLSGEECAVLRDLVSQRSQDLGHEIHHTDSRKCRARLRRQEDMLRALIERIEPEPARATH